MRQSKSLASQDGLDVRLSWYEPGAVMARHAHERHQVSWLLAGEMREVGPGGERDILRIGRGVKPAGLPHANEYGRNGALILGVSLTPGAPVCDGLGRLDDWHWEPDATTAPVAILRLAAAMADGLVAPAGGLIDMAAIIGAGRQSGHETADGGPNGPGPFAPLSAGPAWLDTVREQLRDDPDEPDLARLAAAAGVHRVHLSRSFTRRFGLPPSLYRLRSRVGRAIAGLAAGDSPAEAAMTAGFADQSHFTRAARRHTGLTPRALQALVAA